MLCFRFFLFVIFFVSSLADDAEQTCSFDDPICQQTEIIPLGANSEGKPREAVKDCFDRHDACQHWQQAGECQINPGWMIINCPKSCEACHLRNPALRCDRKFLNISTEPIYQPGDMDSMFSTILSRFGSKYKIEVLSEKPWIVAFDNFVSDTEVNALVGHVSKWERSTDSGQTNEFGETGRILSQGRTSSNAWCNHACDEDPIVQGLYKKIEEVTLIPHSHYESFQILRYDKGQRYVVHHDYGIEDLELACGPRILTFFLYLSDVEEGGETSFPNVGIEVIPKKGRAVLWPSTLSSNPEAREDLTFHEAKPVTKGRKLAANAWIHLYDFTIPNKWGCTGAFDEYES